MRTTATQIRQIGLVCVPTRDQDRAIEFYESIGFEKRTDTSFGGHYRWVEVYPPEGTTGIALAPPPAKRRRWRAVMLSTATSTRLGHRLMSGHPPRSVCRRARKPVFGLVQPTSETGETQLCAGNRCRCLPKKRSPSAADALVLVSRPPRLEDT
jgi:catechol 2,3-dioxygenase-like lactoylglutathione lyase family enzyme